MIGSRAAVRYAKAILDVAHAKGNAQAVNQDMHSIGKAIEESQDLKSFLENPIVKDSIKINALNEIFAEANTDTKSLFQLLLQNKRFDILAAIAQKYQQLFDELNGVEVAYVTTAIPLTESLKEQVLTKIKQLSSKEITIVNTVNPDIIGGFIIRIGDQQYNGSVADKLNQLKREFTN